MSAYVVKEIKFSINCSAYIHTKNFSILSE